VCGAEIFPDVSLTLRLGAMAEKYSPLDFIVGKAIKMRQMLTAVYSNPIDLSSRFNHGCLVAEHDLSPTKITSFDDYKDIS
jgi:hypothetical protein